MRAQQLTRHEISVVALFLAACTTQGMARVVGFDGGAPVTANGPSAGLQPSTMSAQLIAAGLDPQNLPALSALPSGALIPVMKTFAASLGVGCNGCHVADMSTFTPNMRVASKMWSSFVQQLNLADGQPLYCDSCHAGKLDFLDRTDQSALSSFMQTNYVDGVARKDGSAQTCTSCHGAPFDPNFLDGWEAGDGGTLPDLGAASDLASADLTASKCQPSLNEVQVGGTAGASDEFVEIYNPCATPLALDDDVLVYRSATGTSDEVLLHLPAQSIPTHGYLVVGSKAYSGTATLRYVGSLAAAGGGLALLDASSTPLDTLAWGTADNAYVEGRPAPAPPSGQSAARVPDGSHAHADQSQDLVVGAPTPGASN